MNWLDVAGPPGVGKSTLCDPIYHHRAIDWDGKLPPAYWRQFLDEMTRLFMVIQGCPSFEAAVRMNNRSVRKMATVARMKPMSVRQMDVEEQRSHYGLGGSCVSYIQERNDRPYIHTGLVQRGLGFGWRLAQMGADVNLIRPFFWWMPVSIGVVFLEASEETIIQRNKNRELKPETAHENRAFMVPLMREPIRIAKEVLRERGVPVTTIDVESQSPDVARELLFAAADHGPCAAAEMGRGCEVEILSKPAWWR